jgi:O-antigen/teichoic acid export membrane protein
MNIDRVMIRNLLDNTSLGYYSIAIMAHNFVFSFPNAVSVLMFPRFQHRFGQTQNLADLEPLLRTPLLTMTWAVPVFCGGVFLVLPTVVHYILPRYVPGLEAMKILLVGTSFICLTHMPNQFLITLDKQARTASFLMGLVVVAVGLDYLAIRMGLGIEGVAAATTISYLIYYLGLLAYALKHYTDWAGIARFGLSTLLPACVVFSVLFLSDALLETFMLKLLAFGLPAAFFLWKADRHAGLSPFLLDTLRLKWKGASS